MGMDNLKTVGNLPQTKMNRHSIIDNQNAEKVRMNANNNAVVNTNKTDVRPGPRVDTVELIAHKTEHTSATKRSLEEVKKNIVKDFNTEQEQFDNKFQRIKQEVQSGQYKVDPHAIAHKIMGMDK